MVEVVEEVDHRTQLPVLLLTLCVQIDHIKKNREHLAKEEILDLHAVLVHQQQDHCFHEV